MEALPKRTKMHKLSRKAHCLIAFRSAYLPKLRNCIHCSETHQVYEILTSYCRFPDRPITK